MKKTIIILSFLLAAIASNAQKKDSIPQSQLTDTTKYLSIRDVNEAVEGIKDKVTARQYEGFIQIWQYVIDVTSKDWADKHKKK